MTLEAAYGWIASGYSVAPIAYRSKKPDKSKLKKSGYVNENGHASWEVLQTKQPTLNDVWQWFGTGFKSNLGVICSNGLVVIDFDDMAAFEKWSNWASDEMKNTYSVKTRRGLHLYYQMEEPPEFTIKLRGIDVKSNGYVLAPPSIHPSGHKYELVNNVPILRVKNLECVVSKSLLSQKLSFENTAHTAVNRRVANNPSSPWEIQPQGEFSGNGDVLAAAKSVPITQLIQGELIRKRNGWLMTNCPLHDDKTPSFWIDEKSNRCSCNTCISGSMSSVDFYMALHNASMDEALAVLGGMANG